MVLNSRSTLNVEQFELDIVYLFLDEEEIYMWLYLRRHCPQWSFVFVASTPMHVNLDQILGFLFSDNGEHCLVLPSNIILLFLVHFLVNPPPAGLRASSYSSPQAAP